MGVKAWLRLLFWYLDLLAGADHVLDLIRFNIVDRQLRLRARIFATASILIRD